MGTRRKSSTTAPKKARLPLLLDSISGDDAIAILRRLAGRSPELALAVEAVADEALAAVDVDQIAAEVLVELECLSIEDVWDRSGPGRDGYADPLDVAAEMVDEVLQPYLDRVERCRSLELRPEADLVCRGLLRGIYDFGVEATTEFKEHAPDIASDSFDAVLRTWRDLHAGKPPLKSMLDYLSTNCPRWADDASRTLRSARNR